MFSKKKKKSFKEKTKLPLKKILSKLVKKKADNSHRKYKPYPPFQILTRNNKQKIK